MTANGDDWWWQPRPQEDEDEEDDENEDEEEEEGEEEGEGEGEERGKDSEQNDVRSRKTRRSSSAVNVFLVAIVVENHQLIWLIVVVLIVALPNET